MKPEIKALVDAAKGMLEEGGDNNRDNVAYWDAWDELRKATLKVQEEEVKNILRDFHTPTAELRDILDDVIKNWGPRE